MKPLVIGIMPRDQIRQHTLAIARGDCKPKPGNLSRTLKTISNYDIVVLQRKGNLMRPVAKATEFRIVSA